MTGETSNPPIDRAAIAMVAQGARLTYKKATGKLRGLLSN